MRPPRPAGAPLGRPVEAEKPKMLKIGEAEGVGGPAATAQQVKTYKIGSHEVVEEPGIESSNLRCVRCGLSAGLVEVEKLVSKPCRAAGEGEAADSGRLGEAVKHYIEKHPEKTSTEDRVYMVNIGEVFKTWQGLSCPACGLLLPSEEALREHYGIHRAARR